MLWSQGKQNQKWRGTATDGFADGLAVPNISAPALTALNN